MEFNEKLQELRKGRGLTQEELAERLFVSRTAVFQNRDGALGGLLARAVVVVGDDDLADVPAHQPRLLGRQRRAERGHRRVKPRLMEACHVDIALGKDKIPAF